MECEHNLHGRPHATEFRGVGVGDVNNGSPPPKCENWTCSEYLKTERPSRTIASARPEPTTGLRIPLV